MYRLTKEMLSFVKHIAKTPLHLKDFQQTKITYLDSLRLPDTVKIEFFEKGETYAGEVWYRPKLGQVGIFKLEERYRNRGLGKQILIQTIENMKDYNKATHIWTITTQNHPFWANVMNRKFQWYECCNSYPNVCGSGYKMRLR